VAPVLIDIPPPVQGSSGSIPISFHSKLWLASQEKSFGSSAYIRSTTRSPEFAAMVTVGVIPEPI
jgi:hypothetical protein